MKAVYPIVLSKEEDGILVYIPDFDMNTCGEDTADAMFMARDAIGLVGITLEDEGKKLPNASGIGEIMERYSGKTVTFVDVDFAEYRKANDMRTVRRNVSLPSWLNYKAEQAGLNVSSVLQKALKAELGIGV